MSLATVVVVFIALCFLSLLLSGLFIWLGAKVSRQKGVGFRRCLLAAFLVFLINVTLLIGAIQLGGIERVSAPSLLILIASLLAPFASISVVLRASLLKTFVTGIVWYVLSVGYALGFVFVAKAILFEAFVVPTGSMAESIWGAHKLVPCPQCGYTFPVNCSIEAEDSVDRPQRRVEGCTCPNCRYDITFARGTLDPPCESGDRILSVKSFVEDRVRQPERADLIVFDFPEQIARSSGPVRYLDRLMGLPGETIAIHKGDLYVARNIAYEGRLRPAISEQLRLKEYMYENDEEAVRQFKKDVVAPIDSERMFQLVRKSPDQILGLRAIVYDNNHQPGDLGTVYTRWGGDRDGNWIPDSTSAPRQFRHERGSGMDWLRYRHVLRNTPKPQLITDFLGYNSGRAGSPPDAHWVGDLILECEVTIEKTDAKDEFRLELAKGIDRFQARFLPDAGTCTLVRLVQNGEKELDAKTTTLKGAGRYQLRFANVDQRLTVWVNDQLPFGDGIAYDPPTEAGPTENDLRPASIAVQGATLSVSSLKLWRDIYYTIGGLERAGDPEGAPHDSDLWSEPEQWERLRNPEPQTLYVQPAHYLVLGDNSPQSSDSRYWGLVPERMLVGRAVLRYYPFSRAGAIR